MDRIEAKLDSMSKELKKCKAGAAAPPAPKKKMAFKDQILDLHNAFRCMHNTPYLAWDAELARSAKAVADKGIYQLSSTRQRYLRGRVLGESMCKGPKYELTVRNWYKQKGSTTYAQLLWAATKRVGCAHANGLLVCRYSVKGNTAGQYTKQVRPLDPTRSEFSCMATAAKRRPTELGPAPTEYCGKRWTR